MRKRTRKKVIHTTDSGLEKNGTDTDHSISDVQHLKNSEQWGMCKLKVYT